MQNNHTKGRAFISRTKQLDLLEDKESKNKDSIQLFYKNPVKFFKQFSNVQNIEDIAVKSNFETSDFSIYLEQRVLNGEVSVTAVNNKEGEFSITLDQLSFLLNELNSKRNKILFNE